MLHIHRAERADRLAEALGEILEPAPADPFAPEVVAVATRGMERWLAQTLAGRLGATRARRDGICANVRFPFPGQLIDQTLAVASGVAPEVDPWRVERTVWPLLEVVEACAHEPWLAPVTEHLESAPGRRFARVRLIAELLDGYQIRRPEMILEWARGEDAGEWQPELWRSLRGRIGLPSPAERLAPACARLREEPELAALPDRFALFGITRLAPGYLDVLHALAATREVHLLLLHPSPILWELARGPAAGMPPVLRRADDPAAALAANRLLASWGRESRELQLVLAAARARDPVGGETAEHHHPAIGTTAAPTLLAAVQSDIRANRQPPGPALPGAPDLRLVLDPADESLRVHACHGRHRQVEVLREAILHRLAADPTLEPRDVIVMCPDIETFAPLVEATFGTVQPPSSDGDAEAPPSAGSELRVRLADRALRQTNPVLGVAARLLDLASARVTASEVLDLADSAPVRRRFGLDDDDLALIQEWIVGARIHWGLDAEHRRRFKLQDVDAGTFAAGLQRVLLGVAVEESERHLFGGTLPLDGIEGEAIEVAGRFAELVDRLGSALASLTERKPVADWALALAEAADALVDVPDQEAWQRYELTGVLDGIVADAAGSAAAASLSLPEIRALLGDRLGGRPTRANFRTGHLTVCTLHPMRSVPHRVVCLLGLDDGAFPRRAPRNGDDLLLEDPHVGDRDPRAEDRQLLLDALLAARDHVIVTYTGNDERTNAPRPPAVPAGELLDAVEATATCADGDPPVRDQVVVRHPLQPFDPRNFAPRVIAGAGPWSFDDVALEGARALVSARRPPRPFLATALAPVPRGALALDDLVAFVERPVRAFMRQRLGIVTGIREDEIDDALPVLLNPLQSWGIGQRLLDALLAGTDPRECVRAEIARGTLPPGALGAPVLAEIRNAVHPILTQARAYATDESPRSLDANVVLPGGTRLVGTVSGVWGRVLLTVTYSRLSARHRLGAWVRLLALTAAHPDVPYQAVSVGRSTDGGGVRVAEIAAFGRDADARRDAAIAELAALADLHARGLREPLPLPCLSAAAYAAARRSGEDPVKAATAEWLSPFGFDREDRDSDHQLAFGGVLTFAELIAIPPTPDERGPGWPLEPSRFATLALRLWDPLLAREAVTPQ
jgi:exodeoxyribonuclease V gamma subunit